MILPVACEHPLSSKRRMPRLDYNALIIWIALIDYYNYFDSSGSYEILGSRLFIKTCPGICKWCNYYFEQN